MAMNGSGVRDTSRVLGVSITTVMAHLKKLRLVKVNPQPTQAVMEHRAVEIVCEMDEQWPMWVLKSNRIGCGMRGNRI